MPIGQQDRIQLWTRVGLAALVEGAKAVPGVGSLIAAAIAGAGEYLKETISAQELPKQARDAVRQLAHEYRELLAHEFLRHRDDNTLELALVATLEILSMQGLSAYDLVRKTGLDGERAARLTLQREQVKETLTKLYDTNAQELTERLVKEYYRILLSHKEALDEVGVDALRAILTRLPDPNFYAQTKSQLATVLRNQEKLLNLERVKAWRKVRWPDNSYDYSWGLQPLMLRPEYQLVDYVGQAHRRTRDELLDWLRKLAKQPQGECIGLRCYVGPGGAGKTRLLLEVGTALQPEGWFTGFLVPGGTTPETAYLLLETTNPTLLVLDYAGVRQSEVDALLDALATARDREHPYALVLLDRSEPDWLQDAVQQGSDPDYRGRPELQMIGTIESKARFVPQLCTEDLPDLYRASLQGLAAAVDKTPSSHKPPSDLPSRPLYVLLLALLVVAGEHLPEDTSDETSILEQVWTWVLSRWRTNLMRDTEMEPGWIDDLAPNNISKPGILEKLQIVTTLGCAFASEDDLSDFLTTQDWLLRDKLGNTPSIPWLAHRIARLLPSHQDQLEIVGIIQPDPLADWVMHRFCINHESILDWLKNVFPPERSTAQAALVFHRILVLSLGYHTEEATLLRELCKWADQRLQLNEIPALINAIKCSTGDIQTDGHNAVLEGMLVLTGALPQNVLESVFEKGMIDSDILEIAQQPGEQE